MRRCLLAVCALALLAHGGAWAANIAPGYDFFSTDSGGTRATLVGLGDVQFEGFAYSGSTDPTALFPLPEGLALPTGAAGFRTTWLDPHQSGFGLPFQQKVAQVVEPASGGFDTVVQRKADVTIEGIGSEGTVPIEIVWLSLKSTEPVTIDTGDGILVADLYLGLRQGVQVAGRAKLTSAVPTGNSGAISIGLPGTTPADDPTDPDFLGLPAIYDVYLIPHGMDPIPANVIFMVPVLTSVFQNNTGRYSVPEPSALLALGLGLSCLPFRRRSATRQ